MDKRWIERHREFEFERRLREKRHRIARRKGLRKAVRLHHKYLSVTAPAELDFDSHYEQTIRFIEQIRRTSAAGGHTMLIWMRNCVKLLPEVALVLAAEIERCLHHRPRLINGNDPKSGKIAAMLKDIGFHKLLHFNEDRRKG
jgi:hypothetical protein